MEPDFTIEQFKEWVVETFPDNVTRAIAETNFRDGLSKMADFVFQTNSTAFVQESLQQIQELKSMANGSALSAQNFAFEANLSKQQSEGILSFINLLKTQTEQLANNADLGLIPKGSWNPVTNVPAITAVPDPAWVNGSYFDISPVSGNLTFTGQNFAIGQPVNSGDRLKKIDGQWSLIKDSTLALREVQKLQEMLVNNISIDKILPVLDALGRALLYFETDGSFFVAKYKEKSIQADALQDSGITKIKLAQSLIDFFATSDDLTAYDEVKGLFTENPDPISYGFAIVDLNGRNIGSFYHDGSIEFRKLKYTIPAKTVTYSQLTDSLLSVLQPFYGVKLETLGDSITAGCTWQPLLAQLTGMVWSETETKIGKAADPYIPPMGIGGSAIIPIIRENGVDGNGNPTYASGRGPGQSIYIRAGFVHLNNPGAIALWGGANDPINMNFDNQASIDAIWGKPTDAPYTGGEIPEGSPLTPTWCAAFNGTLKKLIDNNPTVRIFAKTRLYATNVSSDPEIAIKKLNYFNNLLKECCRRYSIPVIDVCLESGIWSYNAAQFIPDGVHPNDLGGQRIARLDASKF